MAQEDHIPDVIKNAYELVVSSGICRITESLRSDLEGAPGDAEFSCVLPIPTPNSENLPSEVMMRVRIPSTFPLSKVNFFPEGDEVRGFPHQDAETGKLCLIDEFLAPRNKQRLLRYVGWAKEWLEDAAHGVLLRTGDPYELPDFSRRELADSLPTKRSFLFVETEQSYAQWTQHVGNAGRVLLARPKTFPSIVPIRFWDGDRASIWQPGFSEKTLEGDSRLWGRWVLLTDLRYFRHRPPQTYGELDSMCRSGGVDLQQNLASAWKEGNTDPEIAIVLVGFPIPGVVGQEPSEIHWQPLVFNNIRADRRAHKPKRGGIKKGRLWDLVKRSFLSDEQLPWSKASNISRSRLYARGAHCDAFQSKEIMIIGCGALGSQLAELLARGGAGSLSLLDAEQFHMDNQCRHTLDGRHIERSKAQSLAERLSTINPLSTIKGYVARLPLPKVLDDGLQEASDAIASADLLIDCTSDDNAFDWLNLLAKNDRKRFVSLFFDFGARFLTMCVSGKHTSCKTVFRKLMEDIKRGGTPLSSDNYFRNPSKEEQVIPGAGCWHPTFPARNDHVSMLTGAAIDVLNDLLDQPLRPDGHGILIRRSIIGADTKIPQPLVEIVWRKAYR